MLTTVSYSYKTCTAIGAAGYFACRLLEAPNTGNAFVAGGLAGAFAEAAVRWARPEVVQSMKGMARGATDMAKGAAAKAKEVGATAVDWAKEQATKAAGSAKEAAAKAAKLVTGEPKGKQPDLEASISHDTRSLSPLIGFPP